MWRWRQPLGTTGGYGMWVGLDYVGSLSGDNRWVQHVEVLSGCGMWVGLDWVVAASLGTVGGCGMWVGLDFCLAKSEWGRDSP